MDNDGITADPVKIAVTIAIEGDEAIVDFSGSSPQVSGSVNTVYAVTLSAVYYVFRALIGLDIPANSGCMAPIRVIAPTGTVVNARTPAAVAGGNVETSQRIVDTLLGALAQACPAASTGSITGYDEQCNDWGLGPGARQAVYLLRNDRGRHGRRPGGSGCGRDPLPHDQHPEYARRGAGVCLSFPGAPLRNPA